jgi:hypothetical protein
MQPNSILFILSLTLAAASGCVTIPAPPTAGPGDALPNPGDLQVISIEGSAETPGALTPDQAACLPPGNPNPTGDCEVFAEEFISVAGTLNGTIDDSGHYHFLADGTAVVTGRQVFTGSIAGCGSGSLSFTYAGATTNAVPDAQGRFPGYDNNTLVKGSATTGFAGVVDAWLREDYLIDAKYAATGTVSGKIWCDVGAVPDVSANHAGIPTVAITSTVSTVGAMLEDQVYCDSSNPGLCEQSGTEILAVRGTMNGTVVDSFHYHQLADGSYAGDGRQLFTGSIAGCGSGTLSFSYVGGSDGKPDLAHPGNIDGFDNLTMVPGSATTGLAGVVDARLFMTYYISAVTYAGAGPLTGTVWCTPTSLTPSPAVRTGAAAMDIVGTGFTPGALATDQQNCDPVDLTNPLASCELYAHELLFPTGGTFNGTFLDVGHYHYNTDTEGSADVQGFQVFTGSVAGCGSGTMTFAYHGHFTSSPDPANAGNLHGYDNLTLVPGSTTLGLKGLVDAQVLETGDINPVTYAAAGVITGTIWCASGAGPVAASEAGAGPASPPDDAGAGAAIVSDAQLALRAR